MDKSSYGHLSQFESGGFDKIACSLRKSDPGSSTPDYNYPCSHCLDRTFRTEEAYETLCWGYRGYRGSCLPVLFLTSLKEQVFYTDNVLWPRLLFWMYPVRVLIVTPIILSEILWCFSVLQWILQDSTLSISRPFSFRSFHIQLLTKFATTQNDRHTFVCVQVLTVSPSTQLLPQIACFP